MAGDDFDFQCPLSKVESLEKWYSEDHEEEDGICRPCTLKPLASFYVGVLEDKGLQEQADDLKQVFEQGDLLTTARKMDTIKASVGPDVRSSLENLDCFVQTPDDEA